jgi:hypothetical protein
MNLYRWDTEIGNALAYAASPARARAQILGTLSTKDAMYNNLKQAISGAPEIVKLPYAVMAWHQG